MSLERDDKLLVKFTVEVGIAEGRELQLGEHATREVIEELQIASAIRNKINAMLDSRIGLSYDDGVYTSVEQEVAIGIGNGHAQECECSYCRPKVGSKYHEAVEQAQEIDKTERTARKTDEEVLEEVKEGYASAIRNGDLSVATIDPVERAHSEGGEYMGAFVTMYAFVDDSDDE